MRELTVTAALLDPLLAEPHHPRLTFYDAHGNRTELSTASLANWSAKVAGLLALEVGAVPGDVVVVDLPPGWLHLPILLAAWWAGLVVTSQADPDAVAAFVAPGSDADADEVFAVSDHPLGLAAPDLPAHQRDLGSAARPHADRFRPPPLPSGALAAAGLTVGDVLDRARAAGFAPGARALVTGPWPLPAAVGPLLGPLAVGGSVVALDGVTDLAAVEQVTRAENVTVRR